VAKVPRAGFTVHEAQFPQHVALLDAAVRLSRIFERELRGDRYLELCLSDCIVEALKRERQLSRHTKIIFRRRRFFWRGLNSIRIRQPSTLPKRRGSSRQIRRCGEV